MLTPVASILAGPAAMTASSIALPLQSAAAVAGPALVNWSTRLAPATAVLLTAAPLPTVREIQSKESVGKLPLLPYTW